MKVVPLDHVVVRERFVALALWLYLVRFVALVASRKLAFGRRKCSVRIAEAVTKEKSLALSLSGFVASFSMPQALPDLDSVLLLWDFDSGKMVPLSWASRM
jgi:hypothetical protein